MRKDPAMPGLKCKSKFAFYKPGCYFWLLMWDLEGTRVRRNKSIFAPVQVWTLWVWNSKHTTQGFMHQHNFVLNCSQWVPCRGMWIWMALLFWRLNCNYPDVIGTMVLTLPSKTVFLHLCMAPMVHLVSYTQSNLFGSQTPMSSPDNREERTLLPSNQ